jgi:aldehyde dehydrogenase (NAD+)
VISDEQRASINGALTEAIESGARIIAGGPKPPEGFQKGYYVRPTVVSDEQGRSAAATVEIFGPVLTILAYRDEDDAVRIANESAYALSAAVWSADAERAASVARRIRAGSVIVNGGKVDHRAPFGGFKQSGYGRERGRFGIEEFLTTKAIHV